MEAKIKLEEPLLGWLQEIAEENDLEPAKYAFRKLREFTESTRATVLSLEAGRPIVLKEQNAKIGINDLVIPQVVDNGGNFTVNLGKLLSERLPKAVAVVSAINKATKTEQNWNTLNEWMEEYLAMQIINAKAELDNKELKQEES